MSTLAHLLFLLSSQTTTLPTITSYNRLLQLGTPCSCLVLLASRFTPLVLAERTKRFPEHANRGVRLAECEISQRTRRTVMAGIQKSKFNKRSFGVGGRTDTSSDHRDVADGARDGSEIAAISATRERVYTRPCDATRRSVEIIK